MSKRKKSSPDVTIIDVAREANVSYSTVSRVVNNKSYVKPATRERVLQAMDRLGYQANLHARSLAGGRSHVIGLLVHGLVTQYTGEILRGIDDELALAEYELMLYTTHRSKTRERDYVNMMRRGLADGLLLMLPEESEVYLDSLRQTGFPHVLIDHDVADPLTPSVVCTNQQGATEAVSYLIELGHRRIGFITGTMATNAARDRLAGYTAVLATHNLPFDPALIFEGDFMQDSGYTGTRHLLALPEPPTALFVSSDLMAFGALDAARELGLRVPRDLSIVGFDDIPMAASTRPSLTTVRQPLEEMGRVATRMLLAFIADRTQVPESQVLGTELIVRETTAPPAKR